MLKTVWNWLLGIEHDVEAIVSPLRRVVDDLKAHAEAKFIERQEHVRAVKIASEKANAAFLEADKARSAADKIGALLS